MRKSKVVTATAPVIVALTVLGCSRSHRNDEDPRDRRLVGGTTVLTDPSSQFDAGKEPSINAETHFAAGQLAESQNNLSIALKQYEQALKLDPHHQNALYRSGVVYSQLREYAAAIAMWKRYLEATDHSASGYSNLGFCYELAGNHADAEAAYRKGIARDPTNQPCRVNYGLMLARLGRINEAVIQLQAVLTPAEVAYNLGSIYEQQGRRDRAVAEYRKALRLDPNLKDAETRLAALE